MSSNTLAVNGLSPRVRGKPLAAAATRSSRLVYPRVCGGTRAPRPRCAIARGLSPRVRGNRAAAEVGFRAAEVYPRVCGGTPGC